MCNFRIYQEEEEKKKITKTTNIYTGLGQLNYYYYYPG